LERKVSEIQAWRKTIIYARSEAIETLGMGYPASDPAELA
jgi:hypothetical protein